MSESNDSRAAAYVGGWVAAAAGVLILMVLLVLSWLWSTGYQSRPGGLLVPGERQYERRIIPRKAPYLDGHLPKKIRS